MFARSITADDIRLTFEYGRPVYRRGARIIVFGRREFESAPIPLRERERLEGMQVVTSHDGAVITAYRNRDFRGLRPRRRSWRRRRFYRLT